MIGRILWTCSKGPLKAPCGNPHESQNNVNVFEGRCKDLGDPSQGQLINTQRHMASLFWISRRMLPRTRIGGEGCLRAPKDIRNGVGVHQPIIITLRGLAQEERAMRDRLRVVVPAFDQTAHEIGIARQLLVARAEFRSRGDNVEEDIRLERAAGEVLPAEAVAPAQPVQVREGYLRVLRKRQEHRDLVLEEEDFDDVREVAVSRAVARTVQSPCRIGNPILDALVARFQVAEAEPHCGRGIAVEKLVGEEFSFAWRWGGWSRGVFGALCHFGCNRSFFVNLRA
jgi:hypothetical protein